jgi:oligopeptide/dipeptide ABC transporter ATP-binding protein
MTDTLLSVEHLVTSLPAADGGRVLAIRDVSFTLGRGEILGIAGESGSGKTMSAMAIMGLLPQGARVTGTIQFAGRDLARLAPAERRALLGREIAMVFQDPMTALHPMLTVGRQITEHLRHHRGLDAAAARGRAIDLLERVRIPDAAQALRRYPHQFSGGMRQRVAIATALACGPSLLIADEPTTALDVTVQAGILRLLHDLRRDLGLSLIVITHDMGVMSSLADRIAVMYAGRICELGPRDKVLTRPRHPYARGLLDALPDAADFGQTLQSLPGSPPAPGDLPSGCAFGPRCRWAATECLRAEPDLREIAPGRAIACHVDPLAAEAAP